LHYIATQRRVDRTAVEGAGALLQAVVHAVQGRHEGGIVIGRAWSAVQEGQQAFGNQDQIVLHLEQRRPGAALVYQAAVARWAAAVFGRTGTRPSDTDGIACLRIVWSHAFEPDVMLPQVTQVVLVQETLTGPESEAGEADLRWIIGEEQTAEAGDPVGAALDTKAMRVEILPAHRRLHDGVQVGDGGVAADQHPPPNQGADAAQADLELIDGRGLFRRTGAHEAGSPLPRR
jgi:hypothetical protein